MAHYLRWPDDTGNVATNNFLVQISGIAGVMSNVKWVLAEDFGPHIAGRYRYLYDIRRGVDTTAAAGGSGWIYMSDGGVVTTSAVSDIKINNATASSAQLFTAIKDDVCEFSTTQTPTGGCISLGSRYNEREHCFGLAIYSLVITDANGVHTLDMSSSGGSLNEFTSDTGLLTLKLFNAPVNNSQWVFYGSGPTAYILTVGANIPLFGVAGAQDSTAPSYSSAVAVGVQLFSVSSSQSTAMPSYGSAVAFGVNMFSVAASQDYAEPSGGASVSFDVPLFGAQSSQQSTVPQYSLSANVGVELFGVSSQQANELPSGGAAVSIGVPMFSATASQSATVPQYNMTASVGVPMFSVFTLSGEFNYVATDGGKLDIPALSRQLDIPAQSRRIDL